MDSTKFQMLVIRLDKDTHRQFKAFCSSMGKTMQKFIEETIIEILETEANKDFAEHKKEIEKEYDGPDTREEAEGVR